MLINRRIITVITIAGLIALNAKLVFSIEKSNSFTMFDSKTISYFYNPFPLNVGSDIFQIGGSFTFAPIPLIENEYPIPSFDLQYKRCIFENHDLDATFTTNIFSNLIHLGLQRNFNIGNFCIGVSNHIGGFFGFLTYEGQFDYNTAYSIFYLPTLRFGYKFEYFSITASFSASYLIKTSSKVSDVKEMSLDYKWNDYFCTIAIEQPFMKNQLVSLGLSFSYTRTTFQTWMLYNTIDEYMTASEFFFAFQL